MNLKSIWARAREIEEALPPDAETVFIVSIAHNRFPESVPGIVSEVNRYRAGRWIAEGFARFASAVEAEDYRLDLADRTASIIPTPPSNYRPGERPSRIARMDEARLAWFHDSAAALEARNISYRRHVKRLLLVCALARLWRRFVGGFACQIQDIHPGMSGPKRAAAIRRILAVAR